jgi:hypothetical protein
LNTEDDYAYQLTTSHSFAAPAAIAAAAATEAANHGANATAAAEATAAEAAAATAAVQNIISRANDLANSGKKYSDIDCSHSVSQIYQTPVLSTYELSYGSQTGSFFDQISPEDYSAGDMYVVRYYIPGGKDGVAGHAQINLGNGDYFDSIELKNIGPRISQNPTQQYLQDQNAMYSSEVYLRPKGY